MCEIRIDFEKKITPKQLRKRIESITREYSLAVIEGVEYGRDYPEATENIRFLNDLIFELSIEIENLKIKKTI
ncbi:MAG: hypothetical protein M1292_00750 [Bacteroidetes bacterium]|nr:hypothetical protein [Bacteroidota bacterium]